MLNIWAEGKSEIHPNQWSVGFASTLEKAEVRERNTASVWISHYKLLVVRSKVATTYYESALDNTIIRFRLVREQTKLNMCRGRSEASELRYKPVSGAQE
jgi:hypothetical protein